MTDRYPQIAACVYQACATYDPYMPALNLETAKSWAAAFRHYQLPIDDLLAAVNKLYRERGNNQRGEQFRVMVGDICQAARAIRQDKFDRQPLAAIENHSAAVDARIEPLIVELAESKTVDRHQGAAYLRRQPNPLTVSCPRCHATIGSRCTSGGLTMQTFHERREILADQRAEEQQQREWAQ